MFNIRILLSRIYFKIQVRVYYVKYIYIYNLTGGTSEVVQNYTEDPRYNDSVCYQRLGCKIEFAVIKKLGMNPSKAWITDIFEQFFYKSFYKCIC